MPDVPAIAGLVATIQACQLCDLHKTTPAPVPGILYTGVGVAFLGEAPGRHEEAQGRPFVGQAGRLLENTCEQIGLDFSDIAKINTVCCRPPGNKYDVAEEVGAPATCDPWFRQQIKVSGAWILMPMGNRALWKFKDQRIGQARGKAFWKDNFLIIPTWHPAYVLRNPDARTGLTSDLRQVREILEGERDTPKPTGYEPAAALNALRKPPPLTGKEADQFRLHFQKEGWVRAYSHWLEDHVVLVKHEAVKVPEEMTGVRYTVAELTNISHMDRNWELARRMHLAKKELGATLL